MTNPRLFRCVILALLLGSFPGIVFASGFFTPEIGTRSVARGGAFIAACDDLTAVAINPGALSRIKGTNILLQNNHDVMHTWYRREPYLPAVYNRNPTDSIPFLAVSSDFGLDDWTFAFGGYGPFGVTQRYPDTGPQRYSVHEANSVKYNIMLGIGWQPLKWLRLGFQGGITQLSKEDYYGYSFLQDRNPKYDIKARFLAASDYLFEWTGGIILEPAPWIAIAFSYEPGMPVDLKGTVRAEMPEFYAALLGFDIYEDPIVVGIYWPPHYRGGVRWLYRDIVDFEVAFSFIPWSMLSEFPVDLEKETLLPDFDLPLMWQDSWSYRFGSTWFVNDHWRVSAGYYYEEPATPVKTLGPGGVESERNVFSGGVTLSYFGIDLDLAYAHVFMNDTINDIPNTDSALDDGRGRYKGNYDHFVGGINFNIEKMHYTMKRRKQK